ncbi:hypothetical protein Aeh1ORF116c [Aeromonas phage Aeh1]|uniref:Uncharacterized protein n=1 Tax=Aeromonas phage Aeh1 TaxID=2880362 RepID=Q76YW8_9CAUD|nr:hypothetical protein Aeh1p123 [Aeromonas phage Aeh1]AAQ17778.1 hypothetical protein Aeh1ORF116c [Aeromonas phage Aeh1]
MSELKTETKLTRINNKYHCRLYVNDKLYDEMACEFRLDVGLCFRIMMRWLDKTSGDNAHTTAVRRRMWDKEKYQHTSVGKLWYIGLKNAN